MRADALAQVRHAERHAGPRSSGLDSLRGLALVLMVLDHALLVLWRESSLATVVRLTVTRASLPLFCIVAGSLIVGRVTRWPRFWTLAVGAVAATWIGAPIQIAQPDILAVLAVALMISSRVLQFWPASAPVLWCIAILQPFTWPLPWAGYQPGTVIALVLLGATIGRERVASWGVGLPSVVAGVGRAPLRWYLGHLAVLRLLVMV